MEKTDRASEFDLAQKLLRLAASSGSENEARNAALEAAKIIARDGFTLRDPTLAVTQSAASVRASWGCVTGCLLLCLFPFVALAAWWLH